MRIALLTEPFPPMRSSGAVQLRDLSQEFVRQGHQVTVLTPSPEQQQPWSIEDHNGVEVVRLKALRTRDTKYIRRTVGEFLMPFYMLRNFRSSPAAAHRFDAIVWYSPTIFLGPLVRALRRQHGCPSYLILRDIFPEWAADIGLIGRGPPYRFLKAVANFQYSVADTIGVQATGNLAYFGRWATQRKRRVEVLQNWLAETADVRCPIDIEATSLSGRKIFVYAGNMGIAQGMGKLLNLAEQLKNHRDIGFVFVGRGSDAETLRKDAGVRGLENVLFFDEIEPDEVAGLYAQCSAGLVTLHPRHKSHNIPGKFISYMHSGLPVLASINPGNDLGTIVTTERVGRVSSHPEGDDLAQLALAMLEDELSGTDASARCRALAERLFSSEAAVAQIVKAVRR